MGSLLALVIQHLGTRWYIKGGCNSIPCPHENKRNEDISGLPIHALC